MESEKSCILLIIGATRDGTKKLVAMSDGFRESKESWLNLLRDIKHRGMNIGPKLAIGDGALGFWGAIAEEYPETKHQRCWLHKTRNVMDKLNGKKQLGELIDLVNFIDGVREKEDNHKTLEDKKCTA